MTMRSNKAIVSAAGQTITTAGLAAGGALNPEQAQKFIQQTFEATPLSGLVRHELRKAKAGEIDKIGVGRRLLRKKTENTDDGYRSGVKHGKLEYACTPVRLPWEITEETLRENIEGSNYETIVTNLMTRQIGCDREDLCLNFRILHRRRPRRIQRQGLPVHRRPHRRRIRRRRGHRAGYCR